MRKFLLAFFASLILLNPLFAQTQIIRSQMQPFGTVTNYKYLKDLSKITVSATGTGVTWDFTNFDIDPAKSDFTITIVNPALTPLWSDFPTANYAYKEVKNNGTSYRYFNLNNDTLQRVGSYVGVTKRTYINSQIEYLFPMKIGTEINDTWQTGPTNIPGTYKMTGKAIGTLKLPDGVTYNALYVSGSNVQGPYDAPYHIWYNLADGGIVLQYINGDNLFVVREAFWAANVSPTAIEDKETEGSFTFTNPVEDIMIVNASASISQVGFLNIYNMNGILVEQKNYAIDANSLTVSCTNLQPGMYTINFSNDRAGYGSKTYKFIKK